MMVEIFWVFFDKCLICEKVMFLRYSSLALIASLSSLAVNSAKISHPFKGIKTSTRPYNNLLLHFIEAHKL